MPTCFVNQCLKKEKISEGIGKKEKKKVGNISIFECFDHPVLLYLLLHFFIIYIANILRS